MCKLLVANKADVAARDEYRLPPPAARAVVAYNSLAALQEWLHSPQRRHQPKQERRCCLFTEHRRARMSCAAAAPASPLPTWLFVNFPCDIAVLRARRKEGATHSDFIAREAQSLVHLAGGTKISTGTVSIAAVRPECGGDGARCCSGEQCCVTLLASIIAT